MTAVVLHLLENPGLYRLALFDQQKQQVVAINTTEYRHLEVGDSWVIGDGHEPSMSVVVPFTFDPATPERYRYCLVDADAVEVLPRATIDLDGELRNLLRRPGI